LKRLAGITPALRLAVVKEDEGRAIQRLGTRCSLLHTTDRIYGRARYGSRH
jgi:hypothetical protein